MTNEREITYKVAGMSCGHCEQAVSSELTTVPGVDSIDVDLDSKLVTVRGSDLEDGALRASTRTITRTSATIITTSHCAC